MRSAFDLAAALDACCNIFAEQETAIAEATACAQRQLRNLITDVGHTGQPQEDKSPEDLKLLARAVLSSAHASGKLEEAVKGICGQQEAATSTPPPASEASAEHASPTESAASPRAAAVEPPKEAEASPTELKRASSFREQLPPLKIPPRNLDTHANLKSAHAMRDLVDRSPPIDASDASELFAKRPSDGNISIQLVKRPSDDLDESTCANTRPLPHDGIRISTSTRNTSIGKLPPPVRPAARKRSTGSDSSMSPCPLPISRSRRPSLGAESGSCTPRLDFFDYWANEPESATLMRRPSWGGFSHPSADHDEPDVDAALDEDDGGIKMINVWTKKLKKRVKTPRRPSSVSVGSDVSSDSPRFDVTQSASFGTRASWQAYHPACNEGPMLSPKGSGRLARFKARWEQFALRIILRPSSWLRIGWDLASACIICYDIIWIPLQIFQPPTPAFVMAVFWMATVFWSFDIFVSFVSGYNTEGITELRPRKIAAHYIRTWLVFDLLVAVADWFWLVGIAVAELKAHGSSQRAARLGIAFRCLRSLRLLRLFKANGVLTNLIDGVRSEFWLIMLGLAKRILALVTMSHFVACSWYGLGVLSSSADQPSWVEQGGFTNAGFAWRYTTSLHWALTQFTPASMEVVPENAIERIFNIVVVLVAMVTFSYFVSTITSAMARIHNLSSERVRKFSKLRKYLAENKISGELTGRVWSCAQQALVKKTTRRIHEREVEILPLLPLRLKADLIEEVYAGSFHRYPFFAQLSKSYNLVLRKLYSCALEEQGLSKGRELFLFGEQGDKMFFIFGGTLKFTDCRPEVRNLPSALPVMVSIGQWACEAVLWVSWRHAGQLIAETHSELVTVKADKVQEVLQRMEEPRRYAREFVTFFEKNPLLLRDVLDEDMLKNIAECAFTSLEEECDGGKDSGSEPCSPFFPQGIPVPFASVVPPLPGEAAPREAPPMLLE